MYFSKFQIARIKAHPVTISFGTVAWSPITQSPNSPIYQALPLSLN